MFEWRHTQQLFASRPTTQSYKQYIDIGYTHIQSTKPRLHAHYAGYTPLPRHRSLREGLLGATHTAAKHHTRATW